MLRRDADVAQMLRSAQTHHVGPGSGCTYRVSRIGLCVELVSL